MNQVKNTSSKSSLSSAGRTLVSAQKKTSSFFKKGESESGNRAGDFQQSQQNPFGFGVSFNEA